jgi:hypothetical protein
MRTYIAAVLLSFTCATANAGFFDDMVNSAKQATGQIIGNTVDSAVNGNEQTENQQPQPPQGTQPTQPVRAASPSPKPYHPSAHVYDRQLVRDIQTALNEHGYNAGKPDGLYGPGTRKAITAYQEDKGLAVDGKPGSALLISLQQTPKPAVVSKQPVSNASPEEPTPVSPTVAESAPDIKAPESAPASPATPGTFMLPDCDVLQPWAATYERGDMVEVTPRVQFTSLLGPELTGPLFGIPAERWSHDQFSSVYKKMIACRNKAGKQDKTAFNQFHQAAKGVGKGAKAMVRVDRFRERAAKTVENILEHPATPELPKLVDAAQTALRGEDPTDALSVDAKLAYVAGDVKNLKSYSDYLTEQDRNELIARLEAGKGKVVAASNAIEKELADARKAIAAAPASAAGLRSLQKLAESPVLEKIGLDEAQKFRQEVQQRQREIRTDINRQQAQSKARAEAEASRPIDLRERLVKLFQGDELEELSFGGLSPGMSKEQAISTLRRDWKFDYDGGLSINNDFVATRPIFPQLKNERRNGGKVHLGMMDDKVGQIHYVEYYKAMIVSTTPQAWLTEHLGAPDKVSPAQGGRLLTWKRGDLRLQVLATNQIDQVWRFADFQGKLVISFWSEDYGEYLADLDQRCNKLLEEKRGRGNMSEAMWFGLNCDLAGSAREQAGI